MKVAVVLAHPPRPEGEAPARCAVALLRGLTSHGVEVAAVAARQAFSSVEPPPSDLPVEVVDVPDRPATWRSRAGRLRRPRAALARAEVVERVRAAARGADVVYLDETPSTWAYDGSLPSALHIHYRVRRDRPWRAVGRRALVELVEFSLAERAAVGRHRQLVANSARMASELARAAPRAQVTIAPLSLDPRYYDPAPLDGPPTAGLLGTMAWPPTRAAAERLLRDVWPQIRRAVPDARLVVAGRGTGALTRHAGDETGVEIAGEVPSAAQFLRGLSVLVFPLDRGSGMKVKVLESLACGVPVVTTPAGAEGADGGEGIVVEREDAGLAAAAAAVLSDAGERRDRGRAGRLAFERRYTPHPATAPLVELFGQMSR